MSETTTPEAAARGESLTGLYDQIRDWGRRQQEAARHEDQVPVDPEARHLATRRWKRAVAAWGEAAEIEPLMHAIGKWLDAQHHVGHMQRAVDELGDPGASLSLEPLAVTGEAEAVIAQHLRAANLLGQAEGAALMWRDQWELTLRRFGEREPRPAAAAAA